MRIIFLRCKVHSVRQYLFNFYVNKIKCKRPEMNNEPTHFLTFMNNSKAFSSLDGLACSYQCSDQFRFLPGHWSVKRYWISWDLEKPNSFKKNLNNTRNNIKSQILNKKNGGIVELLIPKLNKIISNQGYLFRCNYEKSSQSNQCTWCSPLKYGRIFSKKSFSWGDKSFFGQKIMGGLF